MRGFGGGEEGIQDPADHAHATIIAWKEKWVSMPAPSSRHLCPTARMQHHGLAL